MAQLTEPLELDEETAVMAVGTFWSNLGIIAVKLISFIYMIIIARLVAQSEVGLFYLGIGMVGVISIFADLGISQTVQRYLPYYLGKRDKVSASKVLTLNIVLGFVLLFIVAIAVFLLAPTIAGIYKTPGLAPLLSLLAIYLCVNQTFNILSNILIALKCMKERSIGTNVQNTLKVVFTVILVFTLGPSAMALAAAFILSLIVGAFYLIYALYDKLKRLELPAVDLRGCYSLLLDILPFGIVMVSISTFSLLISYTGVLSLGYILGSASSVPVGIYSMATAFASVASILAASVISILLPVASGLVSKTDSSKIHKTAQTALRWVLFSTIPIVAFLAAFAPSLLRVIYGADYESGAISLALFSIGTLFYYIGSVQGTLIAAHRLVKLELIAFCCGALVNIALNFMLIPGFGINGAAFASLAAFAVIACINHYYAKREFGFVFPNSAWRNLLAGLIVFGALAALQYAVYGYLLNLPLPLANGALAGIVLDKIAKVAILGVFFAAGCLLYLALLNIMRLFEAEDRQVMVHLLTKMKLPAQARALILSCIFWDKAKN